jgi:hypothetical protein
MAATKKQSKVKPQTDKPTERDEKYISDLSKQAYGKGLDDGQQEVYKIVSDFLSQRMIAHFVGKNDELAKELREIHAIVSQNIKQNS